MSLSWPSHFWCVKTPNAIFNKFLNVSLCDVNNEGSVIGMAGVFLTNSEVDANEA